MNQVNKNNLMRVINKYYPHKNGYSIWWCEDTNTPKNVKLSRLLMSNIDTSPEWLQELKSFLSGFSAFEVQDLTLFCSRERAWNIQLRKNNPKANSAQSICINISALIPAYTIHVMQSEYKLDPIISREVWACKPFVVPELLPVYNNFITEIKSFLESKMQLKEFPQSLLSEVIPGINYYAINKGKFTFYNAFFLDDFYTR